MNASKKLYCATRNSLKGLRYAWQSEWAFRVEFWVLMLSLPCAWYVSRTAVEYILLTGSILMVMVVELLNTAVEKTIDRIGLEHHALSGIAKDLASAAIFLAIVSSVMTWCIILLSHLLLGYTA